MLDQFITHLVLLVLFVFMNSFTMSTGAAVMERAKEQKKHSSHLLAKSLEKWVSKSSLPLKSMGIVVQDLKTGEILYELNGHKPYTPASLTKFATAYGVLKEMKGTQTFVTRLLSSAPINSHGKLRGDLYLVGGGDPTFVSESMWRLVNHLKRTGLTSVTGNLVVDDSLFQYFRYGKAAGRVDRAYDAPTSAMSFNWNSVNVYVRPSEVGHSPFVFADPENEFVEVINRAQTIRGKRNSILVRRVEVKFQDSYKNQIVVTGKLGVDRGEMVIYKSITRPSLWSGYNLKAFLERRE